VLWSFTFDSHRTGNVFNGKLLKYSTTDLLQLQHLCIAGINAAWSCCAYTTLALTLCLSRGAVLLVASGWVDLMLGKSHIQYVHAASLAGLSGLSPQLHYVLHDRSEETAGM